MSSKYSHTYVRVEYPLERGYRMEPRPLPAWLHLTIEKTADSKCLYAHSRIHVNKKVKVGPSYSLDWADNQIIKDLSSEITRRFI